MDGKPLRNDDLSVSAGWGHVQSSRTGSTLVMPGSGTAKQRDYTVAERDALLEEAKTQGTDAAKVFELLGQHTFDIHLNDGAIWKNVPDKVWGYS
jgi:hypothetical protein